MAGFHSVRAGPQDVPERGDRFLSTATAAWLGSTIGLFWLTAVVTAPLMGAVAFFQSGGGFEGWNADPLSQVLGAGLLFLPGILIFGTPVAIVHRLLDTRLRMMNSAARYVVLTALASMGFATIVNYPNYLTVSDVAAAALVYSPLWLAYGLVVAFRRAAHDT